MNQILQKSLKKDKFSKNKYRIEISNEITEIPYGGNIEISNHNSKSQSVKQFIKKRKYQLQFLISSIIAIIFLSFLSFKLYVNNKQKKIAKELLNNYQLTTLYSDRQDYEANKSNSNIIVENPFVIGMIKIDKIGLSYPILSETNDDLLKISICRFAGPMPNNVGNLCIAGHNYIDDSFFSRLYELEIGDLIEVYGLSGQSQKYTVFKKYEVEYNDLTCANQNVGNEKILTLLTCNNSNNKRIIVQAK